MRKNNLMIYILGSAISFALVAGFFYMRNLDLQDGYTNLKLSYVILPALSLAFFLYLSYMESTKKL